MCCLDEDRLFICIAFFPRTLMFCFGVFFVFFFVFFFRGGIFCCFFAKSYIFGSSVHRGAVKNPGHTLFNDILSVAADLSH